jgi:hypothetical protein
MDNTDITEYFSTLATLSLYLVASFPMHFSQDIQINIGRQEQFREQAE